MEMTENELEGYNEARRRINKCRTQLGEPVLDLSNLKLKTLPPEFAELVTQTEPDLFGDPFIVFAVKEINLQGNQLSFLPPEIGIFSELRYLSIARNRLRTLPSEIGNLKKLIKLDLNYNHLHEFPPELGKLSNLRALDLANNRIASLPPEIGKLSALRGLWLHANRLNLLPPELGHLRKLLLLNLSLNRLDSLPSQLGKLTALTNLDLSRNKLSKLPSELKHLSSLESLYLHDNPALELPEEILGPRFDEVRYKKLPFVSPEAILDYYFARLDQGEKPMQEVRILLVGRGRVGKTSLVHRLQGRTFNDKGHFQKLKKPIFINAFSVISARI